MNDVTRLQAQMAELGMKFIQRTRTETAAIVELIEKLAAGDDTAAQDLGYLVHRIHGGGATFGFEELGACAGEIEQLIDPAVRAGAPLGAESMLRLRALGQRLRETAMAAKVS